MVPPGNPCDAVALADCCLLETFLSSPIHEPMTLAVLNNPERDEKLKSVSLTSLGLGENF